MTAVYHPDHVGVGEMLRADFMERAMKARAELIRARAEAMAPVSQSEKDPHRGRYKASFKIRSHSRGGATKDRAEAIVYNDAPEAIFVEFGHRGREPYRTLTKAAFG
jgi:hypothetical protein